MSFWGASIFSGLDARIQHFPSPKQIPRDPKQVPRVSCSVGARGLKWKLDAPTSGLWQVVRGRGPPCFAVGKRPAQARSPRVFQDFCISEVHWIRMIRSLRMKLKAIAFFLKTKWPVYLSEKHNHVGKKHVEHVRRRLRCPFGICPAVWDSSASHVILIQTGCWPLAVGKPAGARDYDPTNWSNWATEPRLLPTVGLVEWHSEWLFISYHCYWFTIGWWSSICRNCM